MNRSLFRVVVLFVSTILPAFGGPPTEQGFWTYFKEGVKDDLVLIGLGMNAGCRVFVPGYAIVADVLNGDDPTESLAEGFYDASVRAVDYLQTPQARKVMARVAKVPKRGEGMKYVAKKAKFRFKWAGIIGWIGQSFESGAELAKAKQLADAYLAEREREYERMRRENAARRAVNEASTTPSPDFSKLEGLVDRQVAYVRRLLAAGQKATRAQFNEFNSLSEQYGKEFDRLRAEIFAMTDAKRKQECLQRLMAINERIVKELDPLLDQAERKRLFKNLSADSPSAPESAPQPRPQPQPVSAQQEHPCLPCFLGDLVGTCSTPSCPNYGRPHRDYHGDGVPSF